MAECEIEGKLWKLAPSGVSKWLNIWRERHFVLSVEDGNAFMAYYEKIGANLQLKGTVYLKDCLSVEKATQCNGRKNIVILKMKEDLTHAGRLFQLSANSKEDQENWFEKIEEFLFKSAASHKPTNAKLSTDVPASTSVDSKGMITRTRSGVSKDSGISEGSRMSVMSVDKMPLSCSEEANVTEDIKAPGAIAFNASNDISEDLPRGSIGSIPHETSGQRQRFHCPNCGKGLQVTACKMPSENTETLSNTEKSKATFDHQSKEASRTKASEPCEQSDKKPPEYGKEIDE